MPYTSPQDPVEVVKRTYVLDLTDLGSERLSLKGSLRPGEVDFSSDNLRQVEPLDWSGVVERTGSEVRLAGSLTTKLELACVRCLEPIRELVEKKFDLLFKPRDSLAFEENAEIKLEEVDTGMAFMTGSQLPLSEVIREQVLLALPMKPLCRPDCRGLCSLCGKNLNENSCDCPRQTINPAFEGLLEFKKHIEDRSS